jgi:hypothetical protein
MFHVASYYYMMPQRQNVLPSKGLLSLSPLHHLCVAIFSTRDFLENPLTISLQAIFLFIMPFFQQSSTACALRNTPLIGTFWGSSLASHAHSNV